MPGTDGNNLGRRSFLGATGALAGVAAFGTALGRTAEVHPLPGRVEAEAFATYDASYIEEGSDAGATESNHWMWTTGSLSYAVHVEPGTYDVAVRCASHRADGGVALTLGSTALGRIDVVGSAAKYDWRTEYLRNVTVTAGGDTTLRVDFVGRATELDWLEFVEAAGGGYGGISYSGGYGG